ncbi:MAG TPA: hypothetical protein VMW95_07160 [Desulfobacterales bacterium]|nr:hypothetical protein [Desulfobacterales bacterium]
MKVCRRCFWEFGEEGVLTGILLQCIGVGDINDLCTDCRALYWHAERRSNEDTV